MSLNNIETEFTEEFNFARSKLRELVEVVDDMSSLMSEDDVIANERILNRMRSRHLNLLTLRRSFRVNLEQDRGSLENKDDVIAESSAALKQSITLFIDTVEEHLAYFRTFYKSRKGKKNARTSSRTT